MHLTDKDLTLTLTVDASGGCTVAEGGGDAAGALRVDSMTAMRLFWGPQSPEAVVLPPEDAGAAASLATLGGWCPLPLYTAPPDSV